MLHRRAGISDLRGKIYFSINGAAIRSLPIEKYEIRLLLLKIDKIKFQCNEDLNMKGKIIKYYKIIEEKML